MAMQSLHKLKINGKAPDFNLKGVDGKYYIPNYYIEKIKTLFKEVSLF